MEKTKVYEGISFNPRGREGRQVFRWRRTLDIILILFRIREVCKRERLRIGVKQALK